MSSKIPGLFAPTTAEMKKAANKFESKETASVPSAAKTEGILKAQKENVSRKNVAAKVHKGPSTRYGQQSDLRDQNHALTASNQELQKHLTDTQQRVAELEQQLNGVEKENADVQRRLRDCHVLLVAEKIDPVSGEGIGGSVQQKEDQRREVVSVSRDLLHELKIFGDMTSKQRAQLEEIQTTLTDLTEARERLIGERENFSLTVAEMEKALDEAEGLLSE